MKPDILAIVVYVPYPCIVSYLLVIKNLLRWGALYGDETLPIRVVWTCAFVRGS